MACLKMLYEIPVVFVQKKYFDRIETKFLICFIYYLFY